MRSYWQLLRLPYQLQLAPIFGWGYLLAGGRLYTQGEVLRFFIVFICFHIGCFGGLTALNSYYDRDESAVGGLWQPPVPPRHLFIFAWLVQIFGVLPLLWIEFVLAEIYVGILLLALGYSHPGARWKGHSFKSLIVVAVGQGVLDSVAGALTAPIVQWHGAICFGVVGATLMVIAFYPLTQLFQIEADRREGDNTLAHMLIQHSGRSRIFEWAQSLGLQGTAWNAFARIIDGFAMDAVLLGLFAIGVLFYMSNWRNAEPSARHDFERVHRLLRINTLAFAVYLFWRLVL